MIVSVKFRGEERDVEVDHNSGYDPDTNSQTIDWHFAGLTVVDHENLEITDEEHQSVFEQLCELLDDN